MGHERLGYTVAVLDASEEGSRLVNVASTYRGLKVATNSHVERLVQCGQSIIGTVDVVLEQDVLSEGLSQSWLGLHDHSRVEQQVAEQVFADRLFDAEHGLDSRDHFVLDTSQLADFLTLSHANQGFIGQGPSHEFVQCLGLFTLGQVGSNGGRDVVEGRVNGIAGLGQLNARGHKVMHHHFDTANSSSHLTCAPAIVVGSNCFKRGSVDQLMEHGLCRIVQQIDGLGAGIDPALCSGWGSGAIELTDLGHGARHNPVAVGSHGINHSAQDSSLFSSQLGRQVSQCLRRHDPHTRLVLSSQRVQDRVGGFHRGLFLDSSQLSSKVDIQLLGNAHRVCAV